MTLNKSERKGRKKREDGTRFVAKLEVKSFSKAKASEVREGSRRRQGRPLISARGVQATAESEASLHFVPSAPLFPHPRPGPAEASCVSLTAHVHSLIYRPSGCSLGSDQLSSALGMGRNTAVREKYTMSALGELTVSEERRQSKSKSNHI